MECEALLAYLSEYIDRNLEDDLQQDAQQHLATCRNCRVVLDTTQQAIFLFRKQGQWVIPASRRQRLFDQLQDVFLQRDENTNSGT